MSHTRDENKNKWNHHTVICYRSHLLREPGFTPLIFVIIPNPNPQVEKKHCGCFWKTPVTSFWQFTCCIHLYVYTHLLIGSMGMVYLPRTGLISVVNVGKNASPMDPIGYVYIYYKYVGSCQNTGSEWIMQVQKNDPTWICMFDASKK